MRGREGRRHAHSTERTCERRKLTDELRRRVDEILVTASLPKSTPAGLDVGRELRNGCAVSQSPRTMTRRESPAPSSPLPRGGDGLTFATKGEIIVSSGGIADLPAHLTLFSPFLRILPSS